LPSLANVATELALENVCSGTMLPQNPISSTIEESGFERSSSTRVGETAFAEVKLASWP
jgi:hypothetical protein